LSEQSLLILIFKCYTQGTRDAGKRGHDESIAPALQKGRQQEEWCFMTVALVIS